jgi:uncharacterized protein (DUF885 family)
MNQWILALVLILAGSYAAAGESKSWVEQSNRYTQMLQQVRFAHFPESGSEQGLAAYDERISNPTLADQLAERRELEAALAKIEAARPRVSDENVRQDIEILSRSFRIRFRQQDYRLAHKVPFENASETVFAGLRGLLDDQVAPARRAAALVRLRKYAGIEPGYRPFAQTLEQRAREQMLKPGVIYPSRSEIETELGRDSNYLDGIAALFGKYHVQGWEAPYQILKEELTAYDTWVRANILPKARADFRLPAEEYALAFENYGIDLSPAQIATLAHVAFGQCQAQMTALAAQIAARHGYPSGDYRAVIRELKKQQITGDAILPFYETRLHEIERIIAAHQLVSLPTRPAIIRLATPAETAQEPAPTMHPPPLLHNTGERGQFVLPLSAPSATGATAERYDDFTFDAVAWAVTAHEARPGHELQFDSMVEHGISLARARFAFNSTNVEGWGLYSEYLVQPYEPVEGQLLTLQLRLLRAARAFLDPELQTGKVTPQQAYEVLENDVMLSHAFAREEVERFTYRAPGQANSYFYGYTRLLELRQLTEAALGARFNQRKFHDFILSQGLLPPDLMRAAVRAHFIPSQRVESTRSAAASGVG